VVVALVNVFVPYTFLPIYVFLVVGARPRGFDWSLPAAARVLGA
jgi:hypothetical protein